LHYYDHLSVRVLLQVTCLSPEHRKVLASPPSFLEAVRIQYQLYFVVSLLSRVVQKLRSHACRVSRMGSRRQDMVLIPEKTKILGEVLIGVKTHSKAKTSPFMATVTRAVQNPGSMKDGTRFTGSIKGTRGENDVVMRRCGDAQGPEMST
jgi:hypothetical protein